jgi:hypothetical protein
MTVNWATTRGTGSTTGAVEWDVPAADGSCPRDLAGLRNVAPATRTDLTVNGVLQYQWSAELSLSADTRYCYRVRLGSVTPVDLLATDPTPSFRTQVAPGSTTPYTFAVFGDWGATEADGTNQFQTALFSRLASSGARFAVATGDQAYQNGTQTNYGDLNQVGPGISGVFGPSFWSVPGRSLPLFTTVGNHGITNNAMLVNFPQSRAVAGSGGRYTMDTYCCVNGTTSMSAQSGWYAVTVGNARFYMLTAAWSSGNLGTTTGNTSQRSYANDAAAHWQPGTPEYEWLKADLAASTQPLKFAFLHYPLYSAQPSETADTFLQGPTPALEGLLGQNGVDLVFNGHAHIYERNARAQGMTSYVTGGGGADAQSTANSTTSCPAFAAYAIGWSDTNNAGTACGSAARPTSKSQVYHYLLVSVNGTRVTVTPTNALGQVFDQQSYDFGTTTPPPDTTPPPAPSVTPGTGTYSSAQTVTMASSETGAVIRYTVGTGTTAPADPTATSTRYTGPITVSASQVIKAAAFDAAGNRSPITQATYTISSGPTTGTRTVTLTPVADATVRQLAPTTAAGSATSLKVDMEETDGNTSSRATSYLRFTVPALAPGESITAANLSLLVTNATANGPQVWRSATSWDEATMTFNTGQPARQGTTAVGDFGSTATGRVGVPVSGLTAAGDVSFQLFADSRDGLDFASRENATAANRPQLVLTITAS